MKVEQEFGEEVRKEQHGQGIRPRPEEPRPSETSRALPAVGESRVCRGGWWVGRLCVGPHGAWAVSTPGPLQTAAFERQEEEGGPGRSLFKAEGGQAKAGALQGWAARLFPRPRGKVVQTRNSSFGGRLKSQAPRFL